MSGALDVVSWVCLVSGAALCVVGGIGIVRLPDLYTRAHGASVTDTMGAALILVGLLPQAGLSLVAAKLVMVLWFLLVTSPTASHALVHAAHAHGCDPEVGEDSDELPG